MSQKPLIILRYGSVASPDGYKIALKPPHTMKKIRGVFEKIIENGAHRINCFTEKMVVRCLIGAKKPNICDLAIK